MLTQLADLLVAPAVRLLNAGDHVSPYDLAITLWDCAVLGIHSSEVFVPIVERAHRMAHLLLPADLAQIVWACGKAMHVGSQERLAEMVEVHRHSVARIGAWELTMLLWGMGQARRP